MDAETLEPDALVARLDQLRRGVESTCYRAAHKLFAAVAAPSMRAVHFVLNPRAPAPSPATIAEMQARFDALLERDLENVERGHYPRGLLFQFPAARYVRQIPRAFIEGPRLIRRSHREDGALSPSGREGYPRYYLRNFHWQPDGWFSDASAELYDAAVELLFFGAADVMRRMVLPPVLESVRARGERPRILDLACGTGRALLQMHAALPAARLYGVDLSPTCLRVAAENLAAVPGASLLQENIEALPFQDETFDAVTCIFTLHELPRDARRRAVGEAGRVLRPGADLVLLDADQAPGRDSAIAELVQAFPQLYHEPYFKSYQRDDLAALLEECGFTVVRDEVHFFSRLVVGRRR